MDIEGWVISLTATMITLGSLVIGAFALKSRAPAEAVDALAKAFNTLKMSHDAQEEKIKELTEEIIVLTRKYEKIDLAQKECDKERAALYKQLIDNKIEPIIEIPKHATK